MIADKVTVTTVVSSGGAHTTVSIPFDVGTAGHLHLNGTGGCTACCNGTNTSSLAAEAGAGRSNPSSPVGLLDPAATGAVKLYKTETFAIDAAAVRKLTYCAIS